MNKTFFLPLIIIFFVLYYLVFPREGSTETVWDAVYCESFEGLNPADPPVLETTVIDQGKYKAVIGQNSGDHYLLDPDFKGSLSSTHVFYKSEDTLYLKEYGSDPLAVALSSGNPLVLGERFFSVDYGAAFIEEFDKAGSIAWSWRGLAPLTALAWNDKYTVLGSLDGTVTLIGGKGELTEYPVYPEEADHVVYGVAVSDDSMRVAVISGLRNQYLSIYTLEDSPRLLSQIKLKSHFRRPVKMYFSKDASYLWVEQEKGLVQYTDENPPLFIPVEGSFLTMKHNNEEQLIYIISSGNGAESKNLYSLKSFSIEGHLLFESHYSYFPDSFHLSESDMVFSMNDNIMVLNRREM